VLAETGRASLTSVWLGARKTVVDDLFKKSQILTWVAHPYQERSKKDLSHLSCTGCPDLYSGTGSEIT